MPQSDCPNCGAPVENDARTCPYCGAAINASATPPAVQLDRDLFSGAIGLNADTAEQFNAVRELMKAGNKIEAIKVYREITGVGLKEAKDAVEALESGQPVIISQATIVSGMAALPGFANSAEAMDAIKAELRGGNKIKAIQLHRNYFSTSLAEAKTAVEQIEGNLQFEPVTRLDTDVPAFAQPDAPSVEPVMSANPFDKTERPAWQKWAIGCVAASVILCLCACLPIFLFVFSGNGGK
jgi:ribosomal protein L7/L12